MQDPRLLALIVYICLLCNINELGKDFRSEGNWKEQVKGERNKGEKVMMK